MIYYLVLGIVCLLLAARSYYDDYRFKKLQKEVEYLYKIHRESK